jgi:heat shock protein HslJ
MPRRPWILVLAGLAGSIFVACDQATLPSELFAAQGRWELQSLGGTQISNPQNFTISFGANGELGTVADCNVCGGGYEVKGNDISLEIRFCTEAYCGEASLDREYLEALANTTRYARQGDILTLDYPGGTLMYQVSS